MNTETEYMKTPSQGELFAFRSVQEMSEFVDEKKYEKMSREFVFGEDNKGEDLQTFEDVKNRSQREWAEGIYIFQQFVDRLTSATLPDVKDKRRKTKFSATDGDDIDFDRMRNGEAFWKSTERGDSTGPTEMTVVIDTSTPGFENSDNILWRGAAAIALAKILEEKGWSVEIWVVNGSRLYDGENTPVYTACLLKKTSDPLDISTLINTVSGWFYRTAIFALINTIAHKRGKETARGFGAPVTPIASDLDLITPDEYRVFSSGVFSFEGAVQIIESQLEKIRQDSVQD